MTAPAVATGSAGRTKEVNPILISVQERSGGEVRKQTLGELRGPLTGGYEFDANDYGVRGVWVALTPPEHEIGRRGSSGRRFSLLPGPPGPSLSAQTNISSGKIAVHCTKNATVSPSFAKILMIR